MVSSQDNSRIHIAAKRLHNVKIVIEFSYFSPSQADGSPALC